jgi:hypothetical protein
MVIPVSSGVFSESYSERPASTRSVQKETEPVKLGANEPTQVTRDSGDVYRPS